MTLTGQIGLIPHGTSWVTRGIEIVTRSPVHHVIVAISDSQVIGADPDGADISPVSQWPDAIWSAFNFTADQAQGVAAWAKSKQGTPYNWLDDAAIGVACLLRRETPRWIADRLSYDNTKSLQCAQLADAALRYGAGISVFDDGRLEGAVFPGSFVPYFKAHGWWPSTLVKAVA